MVHLHKVMDGHSIIIKRLSVGTFLPNTLSYDISVPIMFIVFTDCDTISHYNQVSPQG